MPRTPLMHPMRQAATEVNTVPTSLTVDFDSSTQRLSALESAAYRMIGIATCQIEHRADRFVCHLTPKSSPRSQLTADALKERFLELVTDENLRLRISEKTDGIRNVILALAFGSLASSQDG